MHTKINNLFTPAKLALCIMFTFILASYSCGGSGDAGTLKDSTSATKPVDTANMRGTAADTTAKDTSHQRGDATPAPGRKP